VEKLIELMKCPSGPSRNYMQKKISRKPKKYLGGAGEEGNRIRTFGRSHDEKITVIY
jgi:hypothetical protein